MYHKIAISYLLITYRNISVCCTRPDSTKKLPICRRRFNPRRFNFFNKQVLKDKILGKVHTATNCQLHLGIRNTLAVLHSFGVDSLKYNVTSRGSGAVVEHCATSRKVGGSIPDGVIGIFN
jgi:hypothetical protein